MRVLENRATSLFPDNFMVGSKDSAEKEHMTSQKLHDQVAQAVESSNVMTNPVLGSSQANFSNNENLDRSIYSDTMITTNDLNNAKYQEKLRLRNLTQNLQLQNLKE